MEILKLESKTLKFSKHNRVVISFLELFGLRYFLS